jgi:acyl homoserine lactone synthase
MIEAFSWATAHLHGRAFAAQHELRHRLFVERNGWDVPSYDGMEYDQFDTPAATYLTWLDADHVVRGVSRLIPTTRPYMIKELWPHLASDHPCTPKVWEATRFGIDHAVDAATRRRIAAEIVLACQEFGIAHGVERYYVLMPTLIIRRVIAAVGCRYRFLGPIADFGGYNVAAASVEVSPADLRRIRDQVGISSPVLMTEPIHAEIGIAEAA